MKRLRKIFVYLLALLIAVSSLTMTSFAEEEIAQASAVTMKIRKTEGTVKAADKNGKAVSVFKDMRLYNGYKVETLKNGYAWIDLDSTKLIKLDAYSKTAVQKSGKELDIILEKGKLFFNVAEPLAEDETMSIRTSTMAVGIRGTCGWIEVVNKNEAKISILEGTVQAAVINPATGEVKVDTITSGETATCAAYDPINSDGKFDILRDRFSEKDVPGFVVVDTVNDKALVEKIFEKSKTDVDLRRLTQSEARKRLYTEQRIANNEPLEDKAGGDSESSAPSASETPTTPAPNASETPTTPGPPAPSASETPTTPGPSAFYDITYNITDGTLTTFNSGSGKLTISGSGEMRDYPSYQNMPWYSYRGNIKEVVIESGVTSIGSHAFSLCYNLTSVTIPDSVERISTEAFYSCLSLTSIPIPKSVTSIAAYAFTNCKSLKEIKVDVGNSNYCSVDGIVFDKEKYTLVAYPPGKEDAPYTIPDSVTRIANGAFNTCANLTGLTIHSRVSSIDEVAFRGCDKLNKDNIHFGGTRDQWITLTNGKNTELPDELASYGSGS